MRKGRRKKGAACLLAALLAAAALTGTAFAAEIAAGVPGLNITCLGAYSVETDGAGQFSVTAVTMEGMGGFGGPSTPVPMTVKLGFQNLIPDKATLSFRTTLNGGTLTDANGAAVPEDYRIDLLGMTTCYLTFNSPAEAGTATLTVSEITLTPEEHRIEYTVTLDGNGGTVEPASVTATYGEPYGTLPTPTRAGYTFRGWYLGENVVTDSTVVATAAPHTLTAHWEAISYPLTCDPAGGTLTGAPAPSYTVESEEITLPTPTRAGYTFLGWTGTGLTEPAQTVIIPTGSTGDRTYTAGWEVISYPLTCDPAGGTLAGGPATSYTVESEEITLPVPTRAGYTFLGWTGTELTEPTQTVTIPTGSTGDRAYTACWRGNASVVTLDGNGGTVTPAELTVFYGEPYGTLPNPERAGYTFKGWYLEGSKVTESTGVTATEAHTLTARWEPRNDIPYTVRHYLQNGEGTGYTLADTESSLCGTTGQLVTAFSRSYPGYVLQGGKSTMQGVVAGDGSLTLDLYYDRAAWTVTLDGNGGTVAPASVTATYEQPYGTLPTPEWAGYTFKGWYLGENVVTDSTVVATAAPHTLTAHWEVISYPLTCDPAGGTLAGEPAPSYTVESEEIILPVPTRTGYTFLGWTGTGLMEPKLTVTIPTGSTGDRAYTACWRGTASVVTLDGNGGTVAPAELTVFYGEPYGTLPVPTRAGYTFKGWYLGGNKVTESTVVTATEAHTLTARWEPRNDTPYTVRHYLQNEEGTGYTLAGTESTLCGTTGQLVTAFSRSYPGYVLQGGKSTMQGVVAGDGSLTLNLYYDRAAWTVTLDGDGGTVEPASVTATYGQPYGTLPVPTRAGYTFKGWYLGGNKVTESTVVSATEAHTLTARWEPRNDTPYTVRHYLQNGEGTGYALTDTESTLCGTTGLPAAAVPGTYEGFTYRPDISTAQGTVAGDGSLTLDLYYDRILYAVTWNTAGGTVTERWPYGAVPSFSGSTDRAEDDHGSYRFLGWDTLPGPVAGDVTYTARYETTWEARTAGGVTYRTLALALERTLPGGTVYLDRDVTLSADLTVPAGVTLVLPCGEEDSGYRDHGGLPFNPDGTDTDSRTGVGPAAARFRTLTVPAGVTVTVEGNLLVNAVTGRPANGSYDQDVTGGYAAVELEGGLTVAAGGTLDCFGFVTGGGEVTVLPGGTAGDLYVVRSWRGGVQAVAMCDAGVFPFAEADCRNITASLRVEAGGRLEGLVKLYGSGRFSCARFPLIASDGLLRLTGAESYALRKVGNGRAAYTLHGGGTLGEAELALLGLDLSTGGFCFPVDGDVDLRLEAGEYRVARDCKLLTGATLTSAGDAVLTVEPGRTLVLYDRFADLPNTGNTRYPDRPAATLTLEEGALLKNGGSFAGTVYTTEDNVLLVDGCGAEPWTVTTREANGYTSAGKEDTVSLAFGLTLVRPGKTWRPGTAEKGEQENSIVWGSADYAALEEALAALPADLTPYTPESAAAAEQAREAVIGGLGEAAQARVDAWTQALRDALDGLELRTVFLCFDPGGGTVEEGERTLRWGEPYGTLPLPVRPGYAFEGWYRGDAEEPAGAEDRAEEPGPVTLSARWRALSVPAPPAGGTEETPEMEEKPEGARRFSDVAAERWYWDDVDFVAREGLMTGVGNDRFAPEARLSRAMLVRALYNGAGTPESGEAPFGDVPEGTWYSQAVAWAAGAGVTRGNGGSFRPEEDVTREELVTMLYRWAVRQGRARAGDPGLLEGYGDGGAVSPYARNAMAWAVEQGLVTGRGGGQLAPRDFATRAEAARLIRLFWQRVLN